MNEEKSFEHYIAFYDDFYQKKVMICGRYENERDALKKGPIDVARHAAASATSNLQPFVIVNIAAFNGDEPKEISKDTLTLIKAETINVQEVVNYNKPIRKFFRYSSIAAFLFLVVSCTVGMFSDSLSAGATNVFRCAGYFETLGQEAGDSRAGTTGRLYNSHGYELAKSEKLSKDDLDREIRKAKEWGRDAARKTISNGDTWFADSCIENTPML